MTSVYARHLKSKIYYVTEEICSSIKIYFNKLKPTCNLNNKVVTRNIGFAGTILYKIVEAKWSQNTVTE